MRAFEIDDRIDELIEQKSQNSNAVLKKSSQDDVLNILQSEEEASNAPKVSIFQLLRSMAASLQDCNIGVNEKETGRNTNQV